MCGTPCWPIWTPPALPKASLTPFAACPARNQTDARSWAARNLFTLQLAARHALARCGVNAPVQVQLVNMYFDTRRYASGILPAGRYDALRIQIGAGNGRNWWCVVYPPLCTAAASDLSRTALGAGLTEDDLSLITGDGDGYVLRFRSLELWERLRQWLGK